MKKIVYMMRGLPGSGKSYTAKKLAGETGVVCETDAFFDTPDGYKYKAEELMMARDWNFTMFKKAIKENRSPIVVDRGNALSEDSLQYVRYALKSGYKVKLIEPESEWWQEIKLLLGAGDPPANSEEFKLTLKLWAKELAKKNQHRVSWKKIYKRMLNWNSEVNTAMLLAEVKKKK